jgi:UDPglucose--hexose-1-phosphate uridylyltransferase
VIAKKTASRLADGREIRYFDESADAAPRRAVDTRDLPPARSHVEVRRDPLTGDRVGIAAHRQSRTLHPPPDACPLCPSTPGRATEIPEGDYDVVVFQNRFPAVERAEVLVFTAEHGASFAELPAERVRTVADVWADRTAALAELPGVAHVFPFENRGAEIGVTLHHPHGQIYGYPFVPPRVERELALARRYLAERGRPVMADVLAAERGSGERVVDESRHWTAFVPAAARWPVEVHLVPHRQVPDLPALDEAERDDFAELYPRLLRRLDALYQRPLPYVAAWHQAPAHRDAELAWLRLELFSVRRAADKLKYLAGSESGMGVWINDIVPEEMAERLRRCQPTF